MEHLSSTQRTQVVDTIHLLLGYFAEFATDQDLFALQGILSTHASELARRLSMMEEQSMLGPSEMPRAQVTMDHALMGAAAAERIARG